MKTYQTPTAEVVSFHSTTMLAISLWYDFANDADALSIRRTYSDEVDEALLEWEEEDW